jgi:UDP-N-acetylglucosamine 2-epimerase (non-hydrolysing)
MLKVLCIIGTRPEAIKMAPVVMELQKCDDRISSVICVTAQHREMLDSVLTLFKIRPDYDLNVMEVNQTLAALTANVLSRIDPILSQIEPDWVLVQGDTTTVMATALAAFYRKIKIGHVEAGLRTGDKLHPFPEETNRRIVDSVSDLHFAPTEGSRQNLIREGVNDSTIHVTGNTVIDALQSISQRPYPSTNGLLGKLPSDSRIVLVTAHRRESFGKALENICLAIKEIALRYDRLHIVYPVHLNPNVQTVAYPLLAEIANVSLVPPVDYLTMVQLMKRAYLVLTDSGGLQEEMPTFGVPVLILRNSSERSEAIDAGTARLVGTDQARIVQAAAELLDDPIAYKAMAKAVSPFGDGHASARIVRALLDY